MAKQDIFQRLQKQFSQYTVKQDEETRQVRIEKGDSGQGVTLDLPRLEAKFGRQGETGLLDTFTFIEETFKSMDKQKKLTGREKMIFPVIRSTSFPTETKDGRNLIVQEHTAETRIYYALDQGNAYALIDEGLLEREGMTEQKMKEAARFNLRALPTPAKTDEVAGNTFYFVNTNDGYDASRILNQAWIKEMAEGMEGDIALAVPHQDVLILADIRNDQGYDVLAQMALQFFGNGRIPVTALPFLYENGKLEPIFILARKKPKREDKGDQ